jgi:hypothetical protein
MTRISWALAAAVLLAACQTAPADPPAAEDGPASVPSVVVTASGARLVSSVVGAGDARRLVVTHPDGQVVEVARGAVGSHSQAAPRLAVAPDGTVLALYITERTVEGRRFPASDLFLARSSDGGRSFGAPVRVPPDAGFPTGHTFADLAVGPDGAVFVSWLDGTASDRYDREHPAPAHAGPEDPHHGAMQHGGGEGPGTTLVVARSADGGRTFAAPVTVAGGTCPCCRTALDVGPDGAVRVAWRQVWPGGERDAAVATSRDGGRTFGPPVRVHADRWAIDGCPHAGPAVAADADGRVHVAWYTGAEGRSGLWHAVSADGGASFGTPTPLAAGAALGQTRAARDGAGRVWLAWEDVGAGRVRLAPAAGGDTLTADGADPALTGTASGWTLATVADGAVRVRTP